MAKFSDRLALLRKGQGYTQKEVAEKIGVSYPTYNLIEQGKRQGSTVFWFKLQRVFNLTDAEMWQLYSNKEYAVSHQVGIEKREV